MKTTRDILVSRARRCFTYLAFWKGERSRIAKPLLIITPPVLRSYEKGDNIRGFKYEFSDFPRFG